MPTTLTCIGTPRCATPQTYIGNVVVLPALRLVMMKSSNDSEKLSSAAPRMPGKTSGKVTRQNVWLGVGIEVHRRLFEGVVEPGQPGLSR